MKISKKRGNRKAQVTIFMIIGIILLFSTALIFYIKAKMQVPEEEKIPSLQEIPEIQKPVRMYVEQCANKRLTEGLRIAMEHGGLIYTDDIDADMFDPTDGEGVEYYPDSNYIIPYWSYMESKNDCASGCIIETKRPPLCKPGRVGCASSGRGSIEEQIERYIIENMKTCLLNFEDLKIQGYTITQKSNITAAVNIRQKDAVVLINYELGIEKDGASSEIKEYYTTANTKIADMYETAMDILNYTTSSCFYEKYTLDLISSYGGFGKDQIPSPTSIRFESKRYTWKVDDVKTKLIGVLANMMQLIRFNNTMNYDMPVNNYTGEYKLTKEAVLTRTATFAVKTPKDIEIRTNYFNWWDIYVDVLPNEGGRIGPSNEISSSGDDSDVISEVLKALGYKEYMYQYKVSYPIITELYYYDELGKRNVFRFAQEANLRGTTCIKPSTELFSSKATDTQTMLCDLDMRQKENTTIEVYDEFNKSKKLSDAQISFYAGETCVLGYTDADGKLVINMPDAYGWFLSFEKDGYLRRVVHETDVNKPIKIYLKPLFEKKIHFKTINKTVVEEIMAAATTKEAMAWIKNSSEELTSTDKIMMKIERIQDSYQEGELKKPVTYEDNTVKPQDFIKLTKGTYAIRAVMMDKRNFTIPLELDRKCKASGIGDCIKTPRDMNCTPRGGSEADFKNGNCYIKGYECLSINNAIAGNSSDVGSKYWDCVETTKNEIVKDISTIIPMYNLESEYCNAKTCEDEEGIDMDIIYNETNVTGIINGGLLLENTTQYFKILDEDKLYNSENITFYIFRQAIPTRHYHLEEATAYENWSKSCSMYVMPELR